MAVVLSERRGAVEVLTLNRPEARNAIDGDVAEALEAALDAAEADGAVSAVVLTGTPPVFSAGADLKKISGPDSRRFHTRRGGFAGFVNRDFPKPVIAAVNGPAMAGGFEIVLACDLVVAADDAVLGLPEVKRGLFAAAGGLVRLPRRVPLPLAMEVAMTGAPISAERAFAAGLVNRLVPAGRVVDEALALAAAVAANAPLAVRNSRTLVRKAAEVTEREAWALNKALAAEVMAHPDAREGPRAFAEKRPPRWTSG